MTTIVRDRRRSAQNIPLAAVGAGVALAALVVFTAFGGGGGGNGNGAGPGSVPGSGPIATPLPTADPTAVPTVLPTALRTPEPTAVPSPEPTATADPVPTATPVTGDGSDAMPIRVDLRNATGADVYVDIVDGTGLLAGAESGTPAEGMSVESHALHVENVDDRTLKLTWIDFGIDNALALYVDRHEGGIRLLLVQPEPTGPTDAMGFDRELILSFSAPISAADVEGFLQDGLDTPG